MGRGSRCITNTFGKSIAKPALLKKRAAKPALLKKVQVQQMPQNLEEKPCSELEQFFLYTYSNGNICLRLWFFNK